MKLLVPLAESGYGKYKQLDQSYPLANLESAFWPTAIYNTFIIRFEDEEIQLTDERMDGWQR